MTTRDIILIDDDKQFCCLVEDILEDEETNFTALHDYDEQCKAVLADSDPQVVLLDINLPSAKGFEIADDILMEHDYAKIIFVSGLAEQADKEQAYKVGGFDYIDKPFSPQILQAKIDVAVKASVREKENSECLNNVRNSMFQAMTQASELGSLLRFTDESLQCTNLQELATKLFMLAEEMGLHGSISFFDKKGNQEIYYSDGIDRPLEKEIMASARHAGRLVDFGNRTMVNEQNVSFLIRDMPIDDEIRYGMLRDNICFIISALQSKFMLLAMEQEIQNKEQSIYTSNQVINQILSDLEENSLKFTAESTTLLDDMTSDMHHEFSSLNITEDEESRIMDILSSCSDNLHSLFTTNKEIDQGIRELLKDLVNMHSRNQ